MEEEETAPAASAATSRSFYSILTDADVSQQQQQQQKQQKGDRNQSYYTWDGQQVFLNADGSVYNPFGPLNIWVFYFNCFCLTTGLYASYKVLKRVVVTCREDSWRPRHVLFVASIVACILTLLTHCLIPAVYYWWQNDDLLCRVFIALYRLPYIQFLFNLFLAVLDRLVAVTRSIWHRTKLTIYQCIGWLSFLNCLLGVAVKWSFISNVLPVECAFQFIHGLTISITIFVMFTLCTGFFIALFIITWRQLPRAARAIPIPSITLRSSDPPIEKQQQPPPSTPINPVDIEYVPLKDLLPPTDAVAAAGATASVPSSALDEENQPSSLVLLLCQRTTSNSRSLMSSSSFVSSSINLRRMELLVTKHFLFTIVPLFLVVIPYLVFWMYIVIFVYFNPQDPIASTLISYIPYFVLLPSLHALLYPLANLLLKEEIGSCCCSSSAAAAAALLSQLCCFGAADITEN